MNPVGCDILLVMKKHSPTDINQLSKAQLLELMAEQEQSYQLKISSLNKLVQEMFEQLRLQRHQKFGASSEKIDPDKQPDLFNEAEVEGGDQSDADDLNAEGLVEEDPCPVDASPTPTLTDAQATVPKTRGRKPLPANLPRKRVEYDLDDDAKTCSCGCQKTKIGEEISERLEYIPAKMVVEQQVRFKYACKQCEGELAIADVPPSMIPKSNAGPDLLAFVTTAKFQDALPLYRQNTIFKRLGIDLPRNTLANWILKLSDRVDPIIEQFEQAIRQAPVILMDETSVQVNKEPGKAASSKSYMWIRRALVPPDDQARYGQDITLYHYSPNRSGQTATELLAHCQGALMTDGYAGYYQAVALHKLQHAQCWAHARRKFVEAEKALPKGKKSPAITELLSLIQKLYGIEKSLKGQSADAKKITRQAKSKPVLSKLKSTLEKKILTVTPKSKLGIAIAYALKHWPGLTTYLDNGHLPIDNNGAENGIRPFVIGRKNWLFADTQKGAEASAKLYSIIETSKANGHDVYHYLSYLFKHLPQAKTEEDIKALLPWNVDPIVRDGVVV
jgi:transposase